MRDLVLTHKAKTSPGRHISLSLSYECAPAPTHVVHAYMTKQTETAVLDMVTHALSPSTLVETEAGISL